MYIYRLPIKNNNWIELDSKLLQYVSPQRQEKVLKYHRIMDRKLSLYAALLVRKELSQLSGIPNEGLSFSQIPNQKPGFLSADHFWFSISHTSQFVLCCISQQGEVGADVEKIQKAPLEIMDHYFHADERQYIMSAIKEETDLSFLKIWTRKEAYAKHSGLGLVQELNLINTIHEDSIKFYHTWIHGEYVSSVYQKSLSAYRIINMTESEIQHFYLSKC